MQSLIKNKKGEFGGFSGSTSFILTLVVVGIVGAVGLLIMSTVGGSFTGDASFAIGNATEAVTNFFSLLPILGTIFIAVVVIAGVFLLVQMNRNR